MLRDFVLRIHRCKIRLCASPLRSLAPRELLLLAWKAILIGRSTDRYVPHGAGFGCQDLVINDL